ncbi:hypothetical protein EPA93_28215 [Ktedonosporobacter rubrisoli]|uniref:Uncharacterized protein n=1 Tax=Ktedonosporobacter rubrisoli TaxID=2509675 RepID=A0A4P6JW98_KTERU|nr:hypothetical protein [Ktedonosporobacter rubrisoli]QBD79652.1 hypothetical protein EPA93_28215 [Ktedonosporobacter rubrisoli]
METELSPSYPKPFFEIQYHFAKRLSTLSQQPLDQVLVRSTALYRIFGLDWSLDPTNPIWQAYTEGLVHASDPVDWTYRFYLKRYPDIPKFTDEGHWGCFAFEYFAEQRAIHLHFSDQDLSPFSPLSRHRVRERLAELQAMFRFIQQNHPDATHVRGCSWLYNWESYKRLFPPAFGASALAQQHPVFFGRAIWGQFLRKGYKIQEETMSLFLQRVSLLKQVEDATGCFPYPVLVTSAPIQLFYEMYDLVEKPAP